MGFGSLREYERSEKSGWVTPATGTSGNRVLHDSTSDRIGGRADIKPHRGGRVSDLIKAFDNPTTIYDPGADPAAATSQAMSAIVGGGDKGGSGEDPARPKPSIAINLVLAQSDRQLALVTSEIDVTSNWDGETGDGRNSGPKAMLGGEVNLEDEFCMEEEAEEELPQV
jgi:hypothetical protein